MDSDVKHLFPINSVSVTFLCKYSFPNSDEDAGSLFWYFIWLEKYSFQGRWEIVILVTMLTQSPHARYPGKQMGEV